jgi:outer membrane cobalamin receptor
MRFNIHLLFFLFFIFAIQTKAQPAGKSHDTAVIKGIVVDNATSEPIWYANILLFSTEGQKQVNGIATDEAGRFSVIADKPGSYYLEVHFIGYETEKLQDIEIDPAKGNVELGVIELHPDIMTTENIEVQADRSAITYQIDKKVISVDEQSTAFSGNAADVLENVPSVTVDIEGNVALRGSSNFTVLIDGRPTIMEASEVLQQIPASTIENIEIITNPSVKHDPSGSAGIINVVMKKNKNIGSSGVFNANGGLGNKYGGDFIYEYRASDFRTSVSVDYNLRENEGAEIVNSRFSENDFSSFINTSGDHLRKRKRYGIRGEFEYSFSTSNIFSLGMRAGERSNISNSNLNYQNWSSMDPIHTTETNLTERERSGGFYSLYTDYLHKFNDKGHELISRLSYSFHDGDELTHFEKFDTQSDKIEGRDSFEKGPSKESELKIEYTLPFNDKSKFEAGYEVEIENDAEDTGISEYDPVSDQYIENPLFSKSTEYLRNTQSVYTLFANQWDKFGLQGGVRGEYTGREVNFAGNQAAKIDRWDIFPSLHGSYEFEKGEQLMASYSRRIDRVRGWQLEPFETWLSTSSVRIGNPDIQPEYIDSYEMGYLTHLGKTLFSTEIYFRQTQNKIEHVRSKYPDKENTTLETIQNIGEDYSFGNELLLNFDVINDWNINLIGNLYNYKVVGSLYDESFSRESFTWNTRFNNRIKFSENIQFQLDGIYNSPSVSSQGERKGFFVTNTALRFDFMKKQLSATFQIRDIFATGKWESTSSGAGYYSYNKGTREAPVFMLNLRYRLNNYKVRDRGGDNDPGDQGGDEF